MLCIASAGGCANSSSDPLRSVQAGPEQQPSNAGAPLEAGTSKATGRAQSRLPPGNDGQAAGGRADSKAAEAARVLVASATPGSSAYKIGAQDVLDISVFKVPEMSKSVQVADTGTISLPLIGEVPASGRTAQEIERDLAKRLGAKYLRDPQVSVFVKEYNSQRITVEGAVKKPGVFPYRGRTTLLQSIALAEGLDAVSDSNVIVFRTTDGKRAAARFDVAQIRSGKTTDPPLEPGDVVVVETHAVKELFQNLIKAAPLASVFTLL